MGLAGLDTRGEPPPDDGNPSSGAVSSGAVSSGAVSSGAVSSGRTAAAGWPDCSEPPGGRVGKHAAAAEPVESVPAESLLIDSAAVAPVAVDPLLIDPVAAADDRGPGEDQSEFRPDLQTQIRARKAERARVASSSGERVTRPVSATGKRLPGTGPKHRQPSKTSAVLAPGYGRRQFNVVRQLLVLAALTTVLVIVLRTFVLASFYIPSASMEPTLHGCPGCEPDLVMVDKLFYRFSSVSRGDVIVFDRPPGAPPDDKELIKRVIGLPGETVSGHDGKVWIGDRPLREPYVNSVCDDPSSGNFAPVTVARGRYFMMGDNRCDSFDSRRFGTIARKAIVGRAFAVVWPLKHLRWL